MQDVIEQYQRAELYALTIKASRHAMSYAQNRIDLKAVKDEIHEATYPEGREAYRFSLDREMLNPVDITKYHGEAYESANDGDGHCYQWTGWAEMLSEFEHTDDQMKLAKLYDKRKTIIGEAGKIKRAIYVAGKALIKNGGL